MFWLFHLCINGLLPFQMNIFYDNLSSFTQSPLHKVIYFMWTCSTLYGLFYFPLKHLSMNNRKVLYISLSCIALGAILPYQTELYIASNLHVWLIGLGLSLYACIWITYVYFEPIRIKCIAFLWSCILVLLISWFGHINGLIEIYVSTTLPYLIIKKLV